jgi:SPX domain protein involved in polyphosphate accumulation
MFILTSFRSLTLLLSSFRMQKQEGAALLRVRWYGSQSPTPHVWLERKLHHEAWVLDASSKRRFQLPAAQLMDFFDGKADEAQPADATGEEPLSGACSILSSSPQHIRLSASSSKASSSSSTTSSTASSSSSSTSTDSTLRMEVAEFLRAHPVRPVIATKYQRVAFQRAEDDATVRISLDTDLRMLR